MKPISLDLNRFSNKNESSTSPGSPISSDVKGFLGSNTHKLQYHDSNTQSPSALTPSTAVTTSPTNIQNTASIKSKPANDPLSDDTKRPVPRPLSRISSSMKSKSNSSVFSDEKNKHKSSTSMGSFSFGSFGSSLSISSSALNASNAIIDESFAAIKFSNFYKPGENSALEHIKILINSQKLNRLQTAVYKNDLKRVKKLLQEKKRNINKLDTFHKVTSLHIAAMMGSDWLDVLKFLVDDSQRTLEKNGLFSILKIKKQESVPNVNLRMIKIDARDARGRTPLLAAVIHGNVDAVRLLLDKEADIDAVDGIGCCALHYALLNEDLISFTILTQRNANINVLDKSHESLLHHAIKMNRTQIAEIILNHNPVLNIQTADGNSPLHLAIEYQNPVILERLLQAGADPLLPNSNNQSPYSVLANVDGEISASWIPISVKELFIMKATAKEAKSVIGPPKKSFAEFPADDAIQQSPKLIEEAVVEETEVEQFVNFQTESFAQRTESRKSVTAVTTPSANIFGAVERDSDSSVSEDILSGNSDSLTDNSELLKSFGFTKADITTRKNTSSSDSSVSTDSDASSLSENEGLKAGVAVISQQKEDQAVASEILDTVSELYKETLLNPKGNQANPISGSSNHTSDFALSSDLSSALVSIADLSSDDDNFDVSSISLSDSNDDNNISSVPKTAVSETAVRISKKPILASTQKHTSVLNFDSVPKTYIEDIEKNIILEPVVATRKSVESSENDSIISFDSDDNLPIINSTTTVMKQSNTVIPEIKISTEDQQTTVVKINTDFSTETSLLKLQTNKSPLQPILKHTDIPDVQKKNQNEQQLPSTIFPLSKRSGSGLSLQSSISTDMKQPKSPLQSDVSDLLQTLESIKNSLKLSQPTTSTETTSQTTKITQFIQKSRDLYEELEWRSIYLRDVVISLQDHFSDAKVNYDGDSDVDQILENLTGAVVHWKTEQSLKLEEKNKEVIQLKQKFDEVSKEFEVKIAELNKDIALKDSVIVDLNSKLVGHLEGSDTDSSTESEDSKDVIIEKYEQEIKLLAQHIEDSKIATQERDEEHKKVLESLSELEENMKELKNVCRDDQNAVRQLEVEKLALFQECGGLKLKLLEAEERVANLEKKIKVQPETDKTEKEIFALQQEVSHSNKKSKELEESIHTFSAELEEAVKSKEMLQNNLKTLTDSNTLLTTEKKTLSNTIKAISTENKSLKQLISEKNEEINLLHTENLINTALSTESVAAIDKMKTSSQEDLRNSNERIQELLDLIQKHENEKKELEVKFANEKELWNATINEERTNNQKQFELEKSQYLAYVSECLEDIPLALSESDTKISKVCFDLHNWYKIVQNLQNHIQSTESNFPGELRKFGEELIVYVLTRVSSIFNVEETLAELAQIGSEMEQTLTSKQKQEEEINQLRNELKSKAELIEHMQSHISQIDAPENSANEARIIELESEFELKTNQLKDLQRDLLLAKTEIDIIKKDKKEATDALEKELRTNAKEIKGLQATTKQTDLNSQNKMNESTQLKLEVVNLQQILTQTQQKLLKTEKELATQISKNKSDTNTLQNEISILTSKIKILSEKDKELETSSTTANLQARVFEYEQEIETAHKEKLSLQAKLSDAEHRLFEIQHDYKQLQTEKIALENSLNEKLDKLSSDLKSQLTKTSSLETKLSETQQKFESSHSESQKLQKDLKLITNDHTIATEKIDEQERLISTLRHDLDSIQKMKTVRENLQSAHSLEIYELHQQIELLKNQNKNLETSKKSIESDLSEKIEDVEALENKVTDLTRIIDTLKVTINELRAQTQASFIESSPKSLIFPNSENAAIYRKTQELESRIKSLESEQQLYLDRFQETESTKSTLHQKNIDLEHELRIANKKLAESNEEIETLQKKLIKLQSKYDDLESQSHTQRTEINRLENEKEISTQILQGEIQVLKDRNAQSSSLHEQTRNEYAELSEKYKSQITQVSKLENDILSYKNEAEQLKISLAQANQKLLSERQMVETQLSEKQNLLDKYLLKIELYNSGKNELEIQRQGLEIALNKQALDSKKLQYELDLVIASRNQLNSHIKEMEQTRYTFSESVKSLKHENDLLKVSIDKLQNEKVSMEREMQTKSSELSLLKQKVDTYEKEQKSVPVSATETTYNNLVKTLEEQIKNLAQNSAVLQRRITDLESEMTINCKQRPDTTSAQHLKEIEFLISCKDKDIQLLESEVTNLNREKQRLVQKLDSIKDTMKSTFNQKLQKIAMKVEDQAKERAYVERKRNEAQEEVKQRYEEQLQELHWELGKLKKSIYMSFGDQEINAPAVKSSVPRKVQGRVGAQESNEGIKELDEKLRSMLESVQRGSSANKNLHI